MNDKESFLFFLSNLNSEKQILNSLLMVKGSGAFAYYLAPLDNVIRIQEVGGIFPRNFAYGFFDLSSHSIQERRNIEICIPYQGLSQRVKLHDCVNLFLNPINDTFYQFRRNAIIRSWGGRIRYQTVAILEIDLHKLLNNVGISWLVNPINFASSGITQNQNDSYYENFPWDEIYKITYSNQKNNRKHQASELIIYSKHIYGLPLITSNCINRTIVFEGDFESEPDKSEITSILNLNILKQPNYISSLMDPIYNDKKNCASFIELLELGYSAESFVKIMGRILSADSEIGLKFKEIITKDPLLSNNIHGIDHTLRVMFLVLLLAERMKMLSIQISEQEVKSAFFAAYIHDLGRVNNNIDSEHGARSADKYKKHIMTRIESPFSNRCLEAVRVHSLADDPESPDVIWLLLKDADALDRGRFAPPENPFGCISSFLRLSIFSDKLFTRRLMWSSYWLSKVTKYINWGDNPCYKFIDTIIASLYVATQSSTFAEHQTKFIKKIINQIKLLQKKEI